MLTKFITDICKELDITVPNVSYDTSKFATQTMMALYDGTTIYIKHYSKPNPDQLFSVAHELRHAWQLQTNEDYYFHDYKTVNETDIETYNLQLAEVDANAFASLIMINWFGLKPLYNGMSDKVVNAIQLMMRTI